MALLSPSPLRLLHNPHLDRAAPYGPAQLACLGGEAFATAQAEIASWPGYAPTPLHSLSGLAARAGIRSIFYKDEGGRFGLGSFKALGGAYAVLRLLCREIAARGGPAATAADLAAGKYRAITSAITVTCATDGNHGRSVAWGARTFGCNCVSYVHETVSTGRCQAIAAYGAEVRRCPGNYDNAVHQAAADAREHGWFVVSDTSYEGYVEVPRDVMQGYAVMVEEALAQLEGRPLPSHLFIQGGVGGLAAAVCAHLWERFGPRRPRLVVVEPANAACLYESARNGALTVVHGGLETIMAGLACGEPSLIAWRILDIAADDFMTIRDEPAAACMRLLAEGIDGDPSIVAGESAVAGLGGLLLALEDPDARFRLELRPASTVLLFGSEGDTDPALYQRIVGRSAAAVRRGRAA